MRAAAVGIAIVAGILAASPAWSNSLQRTAEAAFEGALGLESIYSGNRQKNFLVRELQTSEERVYIKFAIRVAEDFDVSRGKLNDILRLLQNGRRKAIVQATLRDATKDGGFRLQFRVQTGSKRAKLVKKVKDKLFLPLGEWVVVEIDWIASSGPGANDGSITVWRNGGDAFARKTDLDNDFRVEEIQVGQVSKTKTWFGSVYIDELQIRRRR